MLPVGYLDGGRSAQLQFKQRIKNSVPLSAGTCIGFTSVDSVEKEAFCWGRNCFDLILKPNADLKAAESLICRVVLQTN
ncbi:hypothetical protein K7X08_022280 [Anisodus acutangulus]|uniref:Uncharacterized protein n=1 Tax=Anisodus acutangulus TaxID=402998 RepID=A0A9Q1MHD4_9SOLA|nr:hypothetical protein K7X08_022280 [Anisodus acutangulus]